MLSNIDEIPSPSFNSISIFRGLDGAVYYKSNNGYVGLVHSYYGLFRIDDTKFSFFNNITGETLKILKSTDSEFIFSLTPNVFSTIGAIGSRGSRGRDGATGATGATGSTGATGATGSDASSGALIEIGATTYSVVDTDFNGSIILGFTNAGSRTINLFDPTLATAGRIVWLKDEAGTASINPITIVPFAGELIDGGPFYLMKSNYVARGIYTNNTNWFIL